MPEQLADSGCPRYALRAAGAVDRALITTMHTEARFPLKCESPALAFEARNCALLPARPPDAGVVHAVH
jgi:hypothetical protein